MTSPPDTSSEKADAFIARWQGQEGGQERANYSLFLTELSATYSTCPIPTRLALRVNATIMSSSAS